MMRKIYHFLFAACLLLLLVPPLAKAQPANFNISRRGGLANPSGVELSSLWGYEAAGRKYALLGTTVGVTIVDMTTPSAPSVVSQIACTQSIWRELKVVGQHAYVVADATDDGILIIDLSQLPNSTTHQFYYPAVGADTLTKGHTLITDENDILYISGSNLNNGGVLMFGLSNPNAPNFLGAAPAIYAHDCYARGDTLWTADINAGEFSVYDITNKAAPVFLASQSTPSNFTHNLWISDDGRTLYTTDERADAWVAAYDVSDLSNITEISRYRSRGAAESGVIPHNVHVRNDFLITAYYTDGVIIKDGRRPHNLVEVGRYDTYPPQRTGFFGVWGVYPYFADGTLIASDMQTGLHIFSPQYTRACWLEGNITEMGTGTPIFGASIQILNTNRSAASSLSGFYATGTAQAGTYSVQVLKAGYLSATATAVLQNDSLTILDVQLTAATPFGYSGTVREAGTNTPIQGAQVKLRSYNGVYDLSAMTNASGNFSFANFYAENYEISVGHWGHHTQQFAQQTITAANNSLNVLLDKGYRDEFLLDFGWQVSGDANPEGFWQRAVPTASTLNAQGQQITPAADLPNDLGAYCFVTGNGESGQAGFADVDNGHTMLQSPAMDLLTYTNPVLQFRYWFVNESGSLPTDSLQIVVSNGSQTVTLGSYGGVQRAWSGLQSYRLMDFIAASGQMRVYFVAYDFDNPNLVEAAVDMFEIVEQPISVEEANAEQSGLRFSPNPVSNLLRVDNAEGSSLPNIEVYDALGRLVAQHIADGRVQADIDLSALPTGLYWAVPAEGRAVGISKE